MLHISQRNLFIVKRNFKIQEKHSLLIYLSNSIYIELFSPIYMYLYANFFERIQETNTCIKFTDTH